MKNETQFYDYDNPPTSWAVHYARRGLDVIACKKRTQANHMGRRFWSSDKGKVTCPDCLKLLEEKSEL